MRGYGNGSIYQRGDGKWVAAIMVDGKKRVRYAKTEKEAKKRLRELWQDTAVEATKREDAIALPEVGLAVPTVEAFAEQWLASATIKLATQQSYRSTLRYYILPVIGAKRLDEVKTQDIAAVITAVLKGGKSSRTAEYSYMITRRLLQVATDWDIITVNPALKVKRPKAEHAERSMWSVPQTEAFIATCEKWEGQWDDLWVVALLTGLRHGELLGLMWKDIDRERQSLSVRRNLVELEGGKYVLQSPKTRAGTRTIALTPQALHALNHRHTLSGQPGPDGVEPPVSSSSSQRCPMSSGAA